MGVRFTEAGVTGHCLSDLMGMLETELWSSARAAKSSYPLNHLSMDVRVMLRFFLKMCLLCICTFATQTESRGQSVGVGSLHHVRP